MEKEGLFGMEWSREQQERIRSEILSEPATFAGTDSVAKEKAIADARAAAEAAKVAARAATPVRRPSSSGDGNNWGGVKGHRGFKSDPSGWGSSGLTGRTSGDEDERGRGFFAEGGLVERGQVSEDPMAAPMGVNPGKADDLQRNVSEGEFVVPKDVVDSKGEEFFQKLITSTREAKVKMAEEKAAAQAAQEGQGQQVPPQPQPAPPSNVQPGMTGMLTLPQGAGAARPPLI